MQLFRTHQNRWVARERRTGPTVGMITRIDTDHPLPIYRAEARPPGTDERRLLHDSDALEIAFARIIAALVRAQAERSATGDDGAEPDNELAA